MSSSGPPSIFHSTSPILFARILTFPHSRKSSEVSKVRRCLHVSARIHTPATANSSLLRCVCVCQCCCSELHQDAADPHLKPYIFILKCIMHSNVPITKFSVISFVNFVCRKVQSDLCELLLQCNGRLIIQAWLTGLSEHTDEAGISPAEAIAESSLRGSVHPRDSLAGFNESCGPSSKFPLFCFPNAQTRFGVSVPDEVPDRAQLTAHTHTHTPRSVQ